MLLSNHSTFPHLLVYSVKRLEGNNLVCEQYIYNVGKYSTKNFAPYAS